MPGPPPKRDAERRRRNKDATETVSVDIDELIKGTVEIPVPPTRWVKDPDAKLPTCARTTERTAVG